MKIRLYRPVASFLLKNLGNDQKKWESTISSCMGFPVKLPNFFWEIHLYQVHSRLPRVLTISCKIEKDWYSVFYSYNLQGDLKKYLEIMILRFCRSEKNLLEWKNAG